MKSFQKPILFSVLFFLFSCEETVWYSDGEVHPVSETESDNVLTKPTEVQEELNVSELARESSVTIYTKDGHGSGVFVKNDLVVTNFHVIWNASLRAPYSQVEIKNHAGEIFKATVLKFDNNPDLAILKLSNPTSNKVLELETELPRLGDKIFVAGAPRGYSGTVVSGEITNFQNDEWEDLIQMSAPVSPGSSGGPVVNVLGKLIGVTVSGVDSAQNLNFAVPAKYIEVMLKNVD